MAVGGEQGGRVAVGRGGWRVAVEVGEARRWGKEGDAGGWGCWMLVVDGGLEGGGGQ